MSDKDHAAQELARRHYLIEDGIRCIFRITGSAHAESEPDEPIKLLEINADTVPSGVMPLHFGAAPASGIPYPSIIIEVTPDEFEQIKVQELRLPDGWNIGPELPKPPNSNGSK